MTEQYTYISKIKERGFEFPEFESERHERHIYTNMTGAILLLDANNEPFLDNENGILDKLLSEAESSWFPHKDIFRIAA